MPSGELIIDCVALAHNYALARRFAGDDVETGAVVKANAYGLGVSCVVPTLYDAGCRTFFVMTCGEGVEVRRILDEQQTARGEVSVPCTIVLLAGADETVDFTVLLNNRLTPAVVSLAQLAYFSDTVKSIPTKVEQAFGQPAFPIYLQVDTGMNRLGISMTEVPLLCQQFDRYLSGLDVKYIMTQFGWADEHSNAMTDIQNERLRRAIKDLTAARNASCADPTIHRMQASAANSSALFRDPKYHGDLVRPGISLYGVTPKGSTEEAMKRVITLHVPVLQVRTNVPKGQLVGYNSSSPLQDAESTIITVRVGYGDGLPRSFGNGAGSLFWSPPPAVHMSFPRPVYRLPVIGNISMDSLMVDATAVPPSHLPCNGDLLELVGDNQSVVAVAASCGTIANEFLSHLGSRYNRTVLAAASPTLPDIGSTPDLVCCSPEEAPSTVANRHTATSTVANNNAAADFPSFPSAPTKATAALSPTRLAAPPKEITADAGSYIYAMTQFLHQQLSHHGVRYYLEGGSLLGQVRDGGIIRFDDDADLQVHPLDTEKFLAAVPAIQQALHQWCKDIDEMITLRRSTFGYKLILEPKDPDNAWELHFDTLGGVWAPGFAIVDLFLTQLDVNEAGEEVIVYQDNVITEMIRQRGNGDIKFARLGSLPARPFGPILACVPEFARDAAVDVFGPTCLSTVVSKNGDTLAHEGASAVCLQHSRELFLLLAPQS